MDEAEIVIPGTVDDAELIDRVLYEPSFFCEGRLAPSAFALTGKGETYISVFRNRYYNLEDIKLPTPRKSGDSVAGIARLKTQEVRAISSPNTANVLAVSVEAKKTRTYPFHAGIFTKIDSVPINSGNAHTNPLFMYVQKELVHLSTVMLKDNVQV
jgi:hypothetical protein